MRQRLNQWWNDPAVRTGLTVFLIFRVVLSVWVWGVRQVVAAPPPPDPKLRPYFDVAVETHPWLEPWQRWDTLHYQAIAERGYTAFDTALFTPPLYPALMRGIGALLGGQTLLAGLIVSNLAYLYALIAMYRLTLAETSDAGAARRTVVYLASFPSAFFFLAAYTESLYLLAAILSLAAMRRGRWWRAGGWSVVASLSRLTGALIVVPMAAAGLGDWLRERRVSVWGGISLAVLGAVAFPLYVWLDLNQSPWTPLVMQSTRFGGGLTWPGANLVEAAHHILTGAYFPADVLDFVFTLIFLVCVVPVWRRLPRVYGIYYLAFVLLYLTRIGGAQPLLGMTRYVLALFPAFIVFGIWGYRPWLNRAILYSSWIGLLFMSGEFAVWGWVG